MNALGAALGVYDPVKAVRAAKNYMAVTGGSLSTHAITRATLSGLGDGVAADVTPASSVNGTAVLAIVGGVVAALLIARGAAGWYIGKQIKRPYWGIAAGAIGGAPGLGILSFFPGK